MMQGSVLLARFFTGVLQCGQLQVSVGQRKCSRSTKEGESKSHHDRKDKRHLVIYSLISFSIGGLFLYNDLIRLSHPRSLVYFLVHGRHFIVRSVFLIHCSSLKSCFTFSLSVSFFFLLSCPFSRAFFICFLVGSFFPRFFSSAF